MKVQLRTDAHAHRIDSKTERTQIFEVGNHGVARLEYTPYGVRVHGVAGQRKLLPWPAVLFVDEDESDGPAKEARGDRRAAV